MTGLTKMISNEIQWCIDNPDDELSVDYQQGFVAGLKQAMLLIDSALFSVSIKHEGEEPLESAISTAYYDFEDKQWKRLFDTTR